jgi:uncharacterized protein (TIGR00730 family)
MAAICVYAASSRAIDAAYLDLAAAVGAELARRGHSLVSGGGRVSMMGAVAAAARSGGAPTVGVMPRQVFDLEVVDRDCDELVEVDTMRDRKAEMERRADAFLALPGGIGTMEELFEVWTSASLGMHGKPVAVLDRDGFYAPLWDWIGALTASGFVRPAAWQMLIRVDGVAAAFDALERALRK